MEVLMPKGWARPIGYSNGIAATPGRIVFVAGQVGWDGAQQFHSPELAPQFAQALKNLLAVLAEAGGRPEDVCRLTAYCCDKAAYLAARPQLGRIWRELMGRHFPAMSMVFVSDLLDSPAKIELEATAVVPARGGHKKRVPAAKHAKRLRRTQRRLLPARLRCASPRRSTSGNRA